MDKTIGRFDVPPRMRIIIDNDFSGDPDDFFQLAHHLLSPSVEVRAIIGSHLRPDDPMDGSGRSAANAVAKAHELMAAMGLDGSVPVLEGAPRALSDPKTPSPSAASRAIIEEALREDTKLPLYLVCGAGLTDTASALLLEPRIAERLTIVWIGGNEYPDLAEPVPGPFRPEYNLNIDIDAARTVFNDSSAPIWQVPRDAYRQCLVSLAELEARVRPCGKVGSYLVDAIASVIEFCLDKRGISLGETYALGDSPLVLLTALQCSYQPDPSSSAYVLKERPTILADGSYGPSAQRGAIRVYTRIDTRLMFEDMYLKLRRYA
jgi:inosine-uridine nucleoside N-ribohydrolase